MSKAKKKTVAPSGTEKATRGRYICISAHDEPKALGGHVKREVGAEDVFDKDPGPCWRRIEKTTDNTGGEG